MKLNFKTAAAVVLTGSLLWTALGNDADAVRRSRGIRLSGVTYSHSNKSQISSNDVSSSSVSLPYIAGVGTGLWAGSWYTNRWWRDRSVPSYYWEQPTTVSDNACSAQLYLDTSTGTQIWGTTCSTTEELRAKVQAQLSGLPAASTSFVSAEQSYSQSFPINDSPLPKSRGLGVLFDWLSGDS